MLTENTVLQERYKIIRTIGQGGQGAVYMAKDLRLNNIVALKENFFNDERMVRAFEHEAQLLAGLRHTALPKVFDHFSEDDKQFLVMEFIFGDDFAEVLEKRKVKMPPAGVPKPFEVQDVIVWAEQLLDTLDYLHTQSHPVIHRDIKPQNLKLGHRNQVILLDFGLAKGSSSKSSLLRTTSGSVLGYTPSYAPLEQIQGAGTDPRSDLYSLAATLYHLVTGVPPIGAAIRADAFLGSEPDPLRRPHFLNPKIPPGFSHFLMRALEQHRNNRPVCAAEMLEMLRSLTRPGFFTPVEDNEKFTPTVKDLEKQRQRQADEEIRKALEEAENRRQRLEEEVRKAKEDADRLRRQEEAARKAREEAEKLHQQEEAARRAREEAEKRRLLLEEQARKAAEEAERFKLYEEQARIARDEMEQRRAQPTSYQTKADENDRLHLLEKQERRARQEAEVLRQQLEEQARRTKEELERRRAQEAEAQLAKREAERLRQEEAARKAREEAERRRLEAELERKAREEAELQKVLKDLEQAARDEFQRQRQLEGEARRAVEEAELLKRQLEEQSEKVKAEAARRRQLEEEIRKAKEEAERKRQIEERQRRALEDSQDSDKETYEKLRAKIEAERQEREARAAKEEQVRRRLEEELERLRLEEIEKQNLEKQARAAGEEAALLKGKLAEQERRARAEVEKRQQLESHVRAASDELKTLKQMEKERKANAEIERLRLQQELERVSREEAEKNRLLEEQALQAAREASLLRRQIQEQTQKAAQEAALLKQQLEEISTKAAEETERRRQFEEEARAETERRKRLEEEAERRSQLEEEARQAREEAEKRRLIEEQERRARREAERLQLQEQHRRSQEELERLKQELEEQRRRVLEEAERRQQLEEQERQAREEAEARRLQEEQEHREREEAWKQLQQESKKRITQELVATGYETKRFVETPVIDEPILPPPLPSMPLSETRRDLFAQSVEAPNRRGLIIVAASIAAVFIVIIIILIGPKPTPQTTVPSTIARLINENFVSLPSGEFKMGSEKGLADEKPVHTVKITKNLEMDKYEVTQAEWLAVMHTIPEDVMSRGDNYPVHGVYMEIIDRFLAQLNGMDKAHIYRLPTEAEWEYACRAGIEGDNAGNLDEVAWYDKNSGKKIHEVGQKQPNKWGLYDMLGNVKEWCSDYYWEEYYQKSSDREDPQQMRPSPSRSVRGGDCQTPAILCRVSTRFNARPGDVGVIGLRLVREPKK